MMSLPYLPPTQPRPSQCISTSLANNFLSNTICLPNQHILVSQTWHQTWSLLIGILCMQWLREFRWGTAWFYKDAIVMVKCSIIEMESSFNAFAASSRTATGPCSLLCTTISGLQSDCCDRHFPCSWFSICIYCGNDHALQFLLTADPRLRVGQCLYKSSQSRVFYRLTPGLVQTYCIAHLRHHFVHANPFG